LPLNALGLVFERLTDLNASRKMMGIFNVVVGLDFHKPHCLMINISDERNNGEKTNGKDLL
jgi:hypothetical protein